MGHASPPPLADDIFTRAQQTLLVHEQAQGDERYSEEELAVERDALARLLALRGFMKACAE